MRITAHFDTVDEAEFAALAVRRIGDGIFDVSIREKQDAARNTAVYSPIGFFTNLNTGDNQPYPAAYSASDSPHSKPPTASVDIICRPSAAGAVSSALVSHGGHNLRGT